MDKVSALELFYKHLWDSVLLTEGTVMRYYWGVRELLESSDLAIEQMTAEYVSGWISSSRSWFKATGIRRFFRLLNDSKAYENEIYLHIVLDQKSEPSRFPPLSEDQIRSVLQPANGASFLEARNRLMMELIVLRGMNAMSISRLTCDDVVFGAIVIGKHGEETLRISTSGLHVYEWLDARESVDPGRQHRSLFLSHRGEPMSRQAVWKCMWDMARKHGINASLRSFSASAQ